MSKKVAKDNAEENLDYGPYDKDDPEEEENDDEDDDEAGVSTTKSALAAENKKLKEDAMVREQTHADELAAANAKSAKKTRDPKGLYKTQCDDAMKKIKPTIKNIKDNHNVHRECFMLGLHLKDITDALPESDDHEAYKRWLTDNKTFVGLKKQTRKSVTPASSPGAVSANVSRSASVALDLSIEEGSTEDEEAGAGAGAK